MTDASEHTDPTDDRDDGAREEPARLALPPGSRDHDETETETGPEREAETVTSVEEPAKVMRIGAMVKRLLDEVREAPLDEDARARLASIHERSLAELEDGLSPDLVAELHRITLPFSDDRTPSEAELRVAQAQLVGWLEGLFHGIQTALVAQQIAAQQQLGQMRGLPPGLLHQQSQAPESAGGPDRRPTPGQYL